MTVSTWALYLHILGAFVFVAGIAVAAVAHANALRCKSAAEIAALLGAARTGALMAVAGSLVVLGFGLWLVDLRARSFSEAWIQWALGLFLAALVLGALGGQRAKHARVLAERVRDADDDDIARLQQLLRDPVSMTLNYVATGIVLVVLALMIWKPS